MELLGWIPSHILSEGRGSPDTKPYKLKTLGYFGYLDYLGYLAVGGSWGGKVKVLRKGRKNGKQRGRLDGTLEVGNTSVYLSTRLDILWCNVSDL